MTEHDIALAKMHANWYRDRGWNPIPSSMTDKKPMFPFKEQWGWDRELPSDIFDRFPTTNIQLMTGRRWQLLVIDLDGPEAICRWENWGHHHKTWISHSGGRGRHIWFRLEEDYPKRLPKAVLWRGEGEHAAIERLCDNSLVVVPPSIHVKTGRRYEFESRHGPKRIPIPALVPDWILELQPLKTTNGSPFRAFPEFDSGTSRAAIQGSRRISARETTESIRDKLELARRWGLRVVGRPRINGLVACRAIDREDVHPSAVFNVNTGWYFDSGTGTKMGLFDLAVALKVYPDSFTAMRELSQK